MNVILAETAGFCFGVERAVETVYDNIKLHPNKNLYTYGPIIHNDIVTEDLANQGVSVVHDLSELDVLEKGIMIIRSHGITRREQSIIQEKGFDVVDATCPFVKRIHKVVEQKTSAGELVIVIGNPNHPEVRGIVGWAQGEILVIQSKEEAEQFSLKDTSKKLFVVSQTTLNFNKFQEIIEIINKKSYDVNVLNTICSATKERQTEAIEIASSVDAMIVIGDKNSSNTQKLFEICKNACLNTYYIQTLDDLDLNLLGSVETVGITAGASTPKKIIEEVQRYVRINF